MNRLGHMRLPASLGANLLGLRETSQCVHHQQTLQRLCMRFTPCGSCTRHPLQLVVATLQSWPQPKCDVLFAPMGHGASTSPNVSQFSPACSGLTPGCHARPLGVSCSCWAPIMPAHSCTHVQGNQPVLPDGLLLHRVPANQSLEICLSSSSALVSAVEPQASSELLQDPL